MTVQTKETNPKDALATGRLDLGLVPDSMVVCAAAAFHEGALKYGSYNWRTAGVRASVYNAALRRHTAKWWNGEDADPVTGVPHLASMLACIGIMVDAAAQGELRDDRPPRQEGMGKFITDTGDLCNDWREAVKGKR